MASLSPVPVLQFFDNNGLMLSGGKLYTYETGTSTPKTTYTDLAATTPNANPIILDSRGECICYLQASQYRYVLKDSADNTIRTRDGVTSDLVAGGLDGTLEKTVLNVAAMKALTGMADGARAATAGYTAANDGGHGVYRYNSSSSATDNGGTVIAPNAGGGRWLLLLGDRINVRQFGAKGDGTTNDAPAIQAAIDYCTDLSNRKQTLYFPPSNAGQHYRITASLSIVGRLDIVGDGPFSTIIYADGFLANTYVINFNNVAASTVYYSSIRNITIKSSNSLPAGVRIKDTSYVLMKNVQLIALKVGIYITGTACFSNSFEEVTGSGVTSYTVQFDAFTGGGQYMFSACTFTGTDGVYVSSTASTDSLAFYDCNFEQCTVTDMYINGGVSGLTVSGCRSEGLDGAVSFHINPTAGKFVGGLSVTGCSWETDFGNADAVRLGGTVKGINITGNYAGYIGFLQFVNLNGAGEAGVIYGNHCVNSPKAIDTPRAKIIVFGNTNATGALAEYWGLPSWSVIQSSFTATGTGFTSSPTGSVIYSINGKTVTLDIPTITGTSNATTFTLTGAPAAVFPSADKDVVARITDNGGGAVGFARVKTTGVIEVYATIGGGAFTAAGTKAISPLSIAYSL